jgi:hypothetical protein
MVEPVEIMVEPVEIEALHADERMVHAIIQQHSSMQRPTPSRKALNHPITDRILFVCGFLLQDA